MVKHGVDVGAPLPNQRSNGNTALPLASLPSHAWQAHGRHWQGSVLGYGSTMDLKGVLKGCGGLQRGAGPQAYGKVKHTRGPYVKGEERGGKLFFSPSIFFFS